MVFNVAREINFNVEVGEEENEDEDDQSLIHRARKKRPTSNQIDLEVDVPIKRIMRVTQKFFIQEPSSTKSVSTKKKKAPLKAVDAKSRPFIDHLVINVGFLRDHAIERVVELLENQGWSSLFLGNYTLNKELARQFFSTLTISNEDSSFVGLVRHQ